jgi:two-component system sensor histidine kinase PilS (NtrC family)
MSGDDTPLPRTATPTQAIRNAAQEMRARRISYVMLFRLGILIIATLLAGLTSSADAEGERFYGGITWTTISVGFVITILFARMLPRVEKLDSFAFLQTAVDLVLSAILVQLTGGIQSGFIFLYMVAVLGAALMGTRAQCFAATGAALLMYTALASLQMSGVVEPVYPPGLEPSLDSQELLFSMGRTVGAVSAIGLLAAQLSAQLSRSGEEVMNLRALNQHIVSSLASGLVTIDSAGKIVLMNPQALRLLRSVNNGLLGKAAVQVFPGLDQYYGNADDAETRFELERELDGQNRKLGCSLGPLRDAQGAPLGWVLHFQDITDLRQLELDSRRRERLAAIGRLAASVAHEVRNPLAAMAGSAELIPLTELPEDDQRLLKIIRREAARLDRLVGDLLTFTTPRPLELMEMNLGTLVADTIESFRLDPSSKDLELKVRSPGELKVFADAGAMSQVLWNLLRNASNATKNRGHITVKLYLDEEERILEVIDDGPGVPTNEREKVFEPFTSNAQGGFGFGLALVRRIVRDHGGRVTIEDREDGESGARVRIALPSRRLPPASGTFPLESRPDRAPAS